MLSDFNNRRKVKQVLDLTKLPTPTNYFAGLGYQFKGYGTWRKTICPFHEDTNPSLAVHIEKGAFKCFSCGAKGGDVIAFYQLLNNVSFTEACSDLNVWEAV